MFSNTKMSEIYPRGGCQHFSNKSEIQKSLKYPIWGGGGSSLFGKKSAIFPFFNYDASPKKMYIIHYSLKMLLQNIFPPIHHSGPVFDTWRTYQLETTHSNTTNNATTSWARALENNHQFTYI